MHHLLAFRSLVALELSLYISTSLHFLLLNCITYSHSLTANHAHSHSRQQEKTFTAACPWPAVGCNSSCGPSLSSMSWQCVPMHLWVCPTCTYPPVSSEVPPSKLSLPPSRLNHQPSSWWWYQCTKVHIVLADACWKWSEARKYARFIVTFGVEGQQLSQIPFCHLPAFWPIQKGILEESLSLVDVPYYDDLHIIYCSAC